jgi:hypothetical protein
MKNSALVSPARALFFISHCRARYIAGSQENDELLMWRKINLLLTAFT